MPYRIKNQIILSWKSQDVEFKKFNIKKLVRVNVNNMKMYQIISRIRFPGSMKYWESRYKSGGNSGNGSFGELAKFKAETINEFVANNAVSDIIEFGCGDGNQLELAKYPKYLGLDVSKSAIKSCTERFRNDFTKSFLLYDPNYFEGMGDYLKSDLTMSLDVIYHLVEDSIFEKYIHDLFLSSKKYVIIYSSNKNPEISLPHVKHRVFTDYVEKKYPDFKIIKKIENKYPKLSFAEFFIYEKSK